MEKRFIAVLLAIIATVAPSIPDVRPVAGVRDNTPRVFALVHAVVVPTPVLIVEDGAVIIRDGMIEGVGRNLAIPPLSARNWFPIYNAQN